MAITRKKKIVILGMMTHMPVAGNIWLVLQYLVGLERLGYEAYYAEEHAINPGMLMRSEQDDGSALAAAFLQGVLAPYGLGDRWSFHALHADGRYYGMSEGALRDLYRNADLIINLHGGTLPAPEHSETGRLVYLGTDPVQLEIELYEQQQRSIDFLAAHQTY